MIGFRVDANEYVASGHLVRCMTIAKECCKRGLKCMFFPSDQSCVKMIQEQGFDYSVLEVPWDDWDRGIEKMQRAIETYSITKLVVDSYRVTPEYLNSMNQMVPVVYLDDMCKQPYEIAGVIHYSQWKDENTMQELYRGTDTKVLAGMEYVPLREEFKDAQKNTTKKKQIMITTGGTDTYHISLKVAEMLLEKKEFEDYTILVVLGCMNQDEETFRCLQAENSRLQVKKNVKNMAQLMRESTVAVSAGGTTLYEICACRLPVVCFSFGDNQVEFGKEFQRRGIALYSGDARFEEQVPENIVKNLTRLLTEPSLQESSREKMEKMLDAEGAGRIVEDLLMI